MKTQLNKFVIYKDRKGEFRFRVIHRNGNELFKSSEGYKSKKTMLRVWDKFFTRPLNIEDLTLKK